MIGCRVLAPGLPDRRAAIGLVVVAGLILDVEGRGTPCAAARGLGAAANEPAASPGWGRSRAVRRVVSAPSSARATASAGHARHDPGLASPSDSQEVDLPTPDRPSTHRRGDRRADRAAGPAEPELGIPTDPGRTAQARPPSRRLDDPARAHPAADTTRTDPGHRHQLAAVPPHPGVHDGGMRLLPCRVRGHPPQDLRVLRHRDRQPLRPHRRPNYTSGRTVDHPASQESLS